MDAILQQLVSDLSRLMQPAIKASANVRRDLEAHIRQFEVPFDLEPLDRALREHRRNDIARYNDATAAADFYGVQSGLRVANASFFNKNYSLMAILRDDNRLLLYITIVDPETKWPGTVDYSGKARIVIAEPNGKEIISSQIRLSRGEFNFGALKPSAYVARMSPPKPE